GVQDQFGVVVVLLCGRVDLVGGFHLQRMQHPLAVEAECRGPSGGAPEGVHVTDLQVGSVDGLQTVRTGGREDAHEHVVVGITGVVTGRLFADDQTLHVEGGHEVGRTVDEGLHARGGGGDGVHVHQPLGVLDLGLDTDTADGQADSALDLCEQGVEPLNVVGGGDLGQDKGVELGPGAFDDRDDVTVGPLGGDVVHPDRAYPAVPAPGVESPDDGTASVLLLQGCDRVLQVQEEGIGVQPPCLFDEPRVGSGN